MKRHKLNNNVVEMETISAKMIFELVDLFGEGLYNSRNIHIYEIESDKCDKIYRCDCGNDGSFQIEKYNGYEEYDTKNHDWIWIEGTIYKYHCLSTNYSGYPLLTIDKCYDILK